MAKSDDQDPLRHLEATVGHPGSIWENLKCRVQEKAITRFSVVEADWLGLMWSLDAYRMASIPPRGMGKPTVRSQARLAAVYRQKGNWFATLLSLLLQNRTNQQIRPRTKVRGFSQEHQIDLAWPARSEDTLVCVKTNVTGAPSYGDTPSRGAMSDFSNRRKELKFAATDLKLFRRQHETSIDRWGVWRGGAPPKMYFLWAARLRTNDAGKQDDIAKLLTEEQALVNTYLEGVGLVAWRQRTNGTGYETMPVPVGVTGVSDLDGVLQQIASEIQRLVQPTGAPPPAVRPEQRLVDVSALAPDHAVDDRQQAAVTPAPPTETP